MKRLSSWFNPIANEVINRAEAAKAEASYDSNDQSGREVTNAMIESLPSQFAFYTKAE